MKSPWPTAEWMQDGVSLGPGALEGIYAPGEALTLIGLSAHKAITHTRSTLLQDTSFASHGKRSTITTYNSAIPRIRRRLEVCLPNMVLACPPRPNSVYLSGGTAATTRPGLDARDGHRVAGPEKVWFEENDTAPCSLMQQ